MDNALEQRYGLQKKVNQLGSDWEGKLTLKKNSKKTNAPGLLGNCLHSPDFPGKKGTHFLENVSSMLEHL